MIGKSKIRKILIGVILLTVILLGVEMIAGIRQKSLHFVEKEALKRSDIHIGNFSFFQTGAVGREWELKARKAELFESLKKAVLEEIDVTIHTDSGSVIRFQGEEGTIDTEKKNFHLSNKKGPIRIVMSDGYTIELMEVSWDNERKEIFSDSPITVRGDNWEINGRTLLVKTRSEEFYIQNDVRARTLS
jgi:LPS export ABC transporter protein LptC